MQHLRIVGVKEEEHPARLILSDDSGQEFALPIDEALRQATAKPAAPTVKTAPAPHPLTPREIQSRLRAGATVDQVVEASGLSPAHVQRYAGPVQAERAYMAQRAQSTQIAAPSTAQAHRVAFGDSPATLEAMVKVRLRAMDVDLSTLSWDAWRREDGLWQITCSFDVDSSVTHGAGIGLKPPAEWVFQAETRHLRAANRWAESLSVLVGPAGKVSPDRGEAESGSGQTGPRRLTAVDTPFDVEDSSQAPISPNYSPGASPGERRASGPAGRSGASSRAGDAAAPRGEGREHEDLLEVLRARRGQRLGADAEADDRLALMLNRQDPAEREEVTGLSAVDENEEEHSTMPLPRLRPVESPSDSGTGTAEEQDPTTHPENSDDQGDSEADPRFRETSGRRDAAHRQHSTSTQDRSADAADASVDAWGFAYEETPASAPEHAPENSADPTEPADGAESVETEPTDAGKPRKKPAARRANMPKWDDILFGSKND